MSALLDQLRRFNRKERFFLVGLALGKPDFQLGDKFRADVERLLSVSIPADPKNVFVAMDYHLEWLYAAVRGAHVGLPPHRNADGFMKGNQEDVDLLIAYDEGEKAHLILLEAKGDAPWSNIQMRSKVPRLKTIFKDPHAGRVEPHFIFVSPNPPKYLDTRGWPGWIRTDHYLPMQVEGYLKVMGCDDQGKSNKAHEFWIVKPVKMMRSDARNYDGQATLDEILDMCRQRGDEISVGHRGGEEALRKAGYAYAARKRWKWRDRDHATNEGHVVPKNWISGKRLVKIAESMRGASAARV